MEKNKEKVIDQLIHLLHDKYRISTKTLSRDQWDIPLTSCNIGLTGFEIAHLFFEIEKIYGKSFEENKLKEYGFCSINNIANLILSK
jgi:hypothetical protein